MALDRKRVAAVTLRLLDKVGRLTLRRSASELCVKAPALYWHFKSKQELLDEMASQMLASSIAEMLPGPHVKGHWDEWGLTFGQRLRKMLLRHRDGAKMFSSTYLTDARAFEPMEAGLQHFVDAGLSPQEAICTLKTIYCYTIGFTIEEQAICPESGKRDPRYDPDQRAQRIGSKRPTMVLSGNSAMQDFDRQYNKGLRIIVRGLSTKGS